MSKVAESDRMMTAQLSKYFKEFLSTTQFSVLAISFFTLIILLIFFMTCLNN